MPHDLPSLLFLLLFETPLLAIEDPAQYFRSVLPSSVGGSRILLLTGPCFRYHCSFASSYLRSCDSFSTSCTWLYKLLPHPPSEEPSKFSLLITERFVSGFWLDESTLELGGPSNF